MLVKSTLSNIFTVLCCVVITIGIVSLISVIIGIRPFVMISESMYPEVPKNSLVLLNTTSKMDDVAVGDNVAYLLGQVEAMHKTVSVSSDEIMVKSLADDGESTVTVSTYVGKEVLSIPQVGGWIRRALDYKWIVIVAATGLIIIGCIPKGEEDKTRESWSIRPLREAPSRRLVWVSARVNSPEASRATEGSEWNRRGMNESRRA